MKDFSVKLFSLRIVIFSAAALFCIGASARTEYFVDCTRPDDSGNGLTEETAKRTIQAAIDLTNPKGGDIVTVLPGIYQEGKRVSPEFSDHEFRVVITNHVLLRSRDGAKTTIIKGELGAGANKLGPGAVRGVYMRGPSYSAIEGFTITGCATTNIAAKGFLHYGAAVVGSWNQYVLGCIISNNHAVTGAGIYNCNGVRTLFIQNTATVGAAGYDSWYWNSIIANNKGVRAIDNSDTVCNCTCIDSDGNISESNGTDKDSFYLNSIFVGNGGVNGFASFTVLSNSVTDTASENFKVVGESETGASKYQLVAPAFGDWRLVEGSDAIGIANWQNYYKFITDGQKLHVAANNSDNQLPGYIFEEYAYKDYAGNPISANKPMDAGAIQGAVRIEGGRIDFKTAGFHKGESDAPCRINSYAHAINWPSVLACRITQSDGMPTFGCKVEGSYVSTENLFKFPDMNEVFTFAYPPKDLVSELWSFAVRKIYYVDDDGNDGNDGSAPGRAMKTLQKAVDTIAESESKYYNLVKVAPGVYNEGGKTNRCLKNRMYVNNLGVRFLATEGPDQTIIEGAPDPNSEFHGLGLDATRCVSWFSRHQEAAISGFTFRNGHTSSTGIANQWNPTDTNIAAVAYVSTEGSGRVQFLDCVFSNNTASISAVNMGGDFTRCKFVDNKPIHSSGSIGRNATYRYCEFYGNDSGKFTLDNSVQNVYFCSIEGRAAPNQGKIFGSIIVNHGVAEDTIGINNMHYEGNVISPDCNIIHGKDGLTGVVIDYTQADPKLANLAGGDMHILAGSPAIGAARVVDITNLLHYATFDLDGNLPNFVNGVMTAGAYQYPVVGVTISGKEGALDIAGGEFGWNTLKIGETITVTASERYYGRPFAGFVVNGEQMPASERVFEYTVPESPTESITVEAAYGNLGTMMVIR